MKKEMVDKEIKHYDNSFGVAGVILGILSIAFLIVPFVGLVLGIVGSIFSYKQARVMHNKWSKAGLWLCWIGIVVGAVWSIYYIKSMMQLANQYQAQLQAMQEAG